MRALVLLAAIFLSPIAFAVPADTLKTLTESNSQDLAAWQGLAAEARAAGDAETAAVASAKALEIEKQRFPCRFDERFSGFDFWVGEWDVHLENGQLAGTNSIKRSEQGCLLVEEWTSTQGGTGRSINYVDGETGEWVQVWNAASGTQIDIRGGLTDEGMLLEGRIHYVGNGQSAPFRGLWTPLPDGRVRQYFEQSADDGETWTAWFEGFYSRREQAD